MEEREITVDNIMKIPYDYINRSFYKMVHIHIDMTTMDDEKFVYMLGYYPAIYNYFSELYTFCIGQLRKNQKLDDKMRINEARDKRDLMENLMKDVKLQYDSLSRKITVFQDIASRGE